MFNGYKKWFIRGFAALLPTLITLVILVYLVQFINNNFGKYIGYGITQGLGWSWSEFMAPSPEEVREVLGRRGIDLTKPELGTYKKSYAEVYQNLRQERINRLSTSWLMVLVGFFLALVMVTVMGLFLASFMGRRLWRAIEMTMIKIPIIKQIYPYVKQVTDYIFGQEKLAFSHVVALQYPRVGIWSVGFVTGTAIRAFQEGDKQGREYVTVFVPTSPTPFTGFVVTVPKADILDLPITIDQAFRFLISGGVITPDTTLQCGAENNVLDSGDKQ